MVVQVSCYLLAGQTPIILQYNLSKIGITSVAKMNEVYLPLTMVEALVNSVEAAVRAF